MLELDDRPQHLFIGGREQLAAGREWLDDVDPSTGEAFARVARGTAPDVDAAVAAALGAQQAWAARHPRDRGRLLKRLAHRIVEQADVLAALESRDTGKPLAEALPDVLTAANYCTYYGEAIDKVHGEHISVAGGFAVTESVPHGVTGHIVPWNFPIAIMARTVAPALAAGNACVVKPAPETPMTALAIARLATEVGVPAGVLNVVPGLGAEAGAALTRHPRVDLISFTGSPEVGREVMHASADVARPVLLELGGKSPSVVFADADLHAVAPMLRGAALTNAGQVCSALTRVLVERSAHDALVDALSAEFRTVHLAQTGADGRVVGPLISRRQLERVEDYVDLGRTEGAAVAVGGRRGAGDGFFYEPTILVGASGEMRVAREEIFGPVLTVLPFDTPEQAATLANSTEYGLVAAVWTQDIDRALSVASRLQAGQVFINNWGLGVGVDLPFGGVKGSGFGREKGLDALREYSRTKTTVIAVRGDQSIRAGEHYGYSLSD